MPRPPRPQDEQHDPLGTGAVLLLANPAREPSCRVISFVKYALRCHGIIYHHRMPSVTEEEEERSPNPTLRCVLAVCGDDEKEGDRDVSRDAAGQLRMALSHRRSQSTPPEAMAAAWPKALSMSSKDVRRVRCVTFNLTIEFDNVDTRGGGRRAAEDDDGQGPLVRLQTDEPRVVPELRKALAIGCGSCESFSDPDSSPTQAVKRSVTSSAAHAGRAGGDTRRGDRRGRMRERKDDGSHAGAGTGGRRSKSVGWAEWAEEWTDWVFAGWERSRRGTVSSSSRAPSQQPPSEVLRPSAATAAVG
jgi:hypothetical protein